MKVLVGCEYSGTVRDAFISLGHDAMSCDLLPTDKPGPHFQGDVFEAIKMKDWDLAIFHPPCTYLANSGIHWNKRVPGREELTKESVEFVKALWECGIPRVCIENPIGVLSTRFRKPTQIIQPWMFGDPESKATCLWIRGMKNLQPTGFATFTHYRCRCGNVLRNHTESMDAARMQQSHFGITKQRVVKTNWGHPRIGGRSAAQHTKGLLTLWLPNGVGPATPGKHN